MIDILRTISISVITNGAVLALFVWVFKKLFETSLKKHSELYLKEIELANKKNYYKFSKLHDEQAEAINNVYGELVYMSDQVAYLAYHYNLLETHPEFFNQYLLPKNGDPLKWKQYFEAILSQQAEDIKAKELTSYVSTALNKFKKKRIYFSRDVAGEIERLMNLILFIGSEFQNVTYRDERDFKPVVANEVIATWVNAVEASNKLFPILEKSFRGHLGLEEEKSKGA